MGFRKRRNETETSVLYNGFCFWLCWACMCEIENQETQRKTCEEKKIQYRKQSSLFSNYHLALRLDGGVFFCFLLVYISR